MIRVLIADDHGVIRDGLGRLIEALEDIELVGVAADGEEAVLRSRETSPDVVLMDLDMPRLDGIEATRALKRVSEDRGARAHVVLGPTLDTRRAPRRARAATRSRTRPRPTGRRIRPPRAASPPLDLARAHRAHRTSPSPTRSRRFAPRARGPGAARRGLPNKPHRAPPRDQREDRQVTPDAHLSRSVTDRTQAALGRSARAPCRTVSDESRIVIGPCAASQWTAQPATRRPAPRPRRPLAPRVPGSALADHGGAGCRRAGRQQVRACGHMRQGRHVEAQAQADDGGIEVMNSRSTTTAAARHGRSSWSTRAGVVWSGRARTRRNERLVHCASSDR
jgi:CheY-like chemotaxis protein